MSYSLWEYTEGWNMLISLSEIMNLPAGVQKRTSGYEPDTFVRLGVSYPILEKEEVISPHVMTEEHFNKTKDYSFLQNVMAEGVVI